MLSLGGFKDVKLHHRAWDVFEQMTCLRNRLQKDPSSPHDVEVEGKLKGPIYKMNYRLQLELLKQPYMMSFGLLLDDGSHEGRSGSDAYSTPRLSIQSADAAWKK